MQVLRFSTNTNTEPPSTKLSIPMSQSLTPLQLNNLIHSRGTLDEATLRSCTAHTTTCAQAYQPNNNDGLSVSLWIKRFSGQIIHLLQFLIVLTCANLTCFQHFGLLLLLLLSRVVGLCWLLWKRPLLQRFDWLQQANFE